ncbi:MAG: hypothetical protein M3Y78_03565 [Pseudomonadota bacterium]|nr:hypothetical protein [Pseudomonadota bacterium]
MAHRNDTTDDGFSGSLRAANASANPSFHPAAGPFDVSSARRENETATIADALITGMLVVYPVLATVVAVMVGLFLSIPVA